MVRVPHWTSVAAVIVVRARRMKKGGRPAAARYVVCAAPVS
jgi:hypothetical protein